MIFTATTMHDELLCSLRWRPAEESHSLLLVRAQVLRNASMDTQLQCYPTTSLATAAATSSSCGCCVIDASDAAGKHAWT